MAVSPTSALLTGQLPWLPLRTGKSREWDPPTVGEQVVIFSPSGQTAQGIRALRPVQPAAAGQRRSRRRRHRPDQPRRHQHRRSAQPPGNRSAA
ncbi:phage baseplate assembly protein V [uncultured Pseudomonas sp.]|uniref:phage baseplate assembly protein V n=1 Tax=uncultured Pseudomonas sp. TaxID=114707 RepID=UPI0025D2704B|nr:phage baseplate assembly protein V [uncultured Pseudomonas sp.]